MSGFRFAKRELSKHEAKVLAEVHETPNGTECTVGRLSERTKIEAASVRICLARLRNMELVSAPHGGLPSVTDEGITKLLRMGLAKRSPNYVPKRLRTPIPEGCRFKETCHRPCRSAFALCRTCENLKRAEHQRQFGLTKHQEQMLEAISARPGMTRLEITNMFGGGTTAEKRLQALIEKKKIHRVKPDHLKPRQWRYYPI